MTNNKLQAYADRVGNILDEIDMLKADINDIYEEVKSAQFKPAILRSIIAERRKKIDPQIEALKEEYRAMLGTPGATYRSVAEQTGISKSKLQRLVPRKENGTPEEGGDRQSASRGGEASADVTTASASSPPPITKAEGVATAIARAAGLPVPMPKMTTDPMFNGGDDLTLPAFLDRRTA